MCAHNSIQIKICLVKRGIVEDESYPICHVETKSIIHALRDYPRIKNVSLARYYSIEWGFLGKQPSRLDGFKWKAK